MASAHPLHSYPAEVLTLAGVLYTLLTASLPHQSESPTRAGPLSYSPHHPQNHTQVSGIWQVLSNIW